VLEDVAEDQAVERARLDRRKAVLDVEAEDGTAANRYSLKPSW
jgi:hypothetical protein